ncbi:MAG: cyclic nucleotide-binding domain-containing protein, partial [Bacteroidota bacterium]
MKDPRFPELTQRQINTLKPFGKTECHEDGVRVFTLGDLQYDFFVVLDGAVVIEDPYNQSEIVTHHKNEFTGDSGMLSNRAAQFHAVTVGNTQVLRIVPSALKQAIARHSDISDVLLNAFLLRQESVLRDYTGGLKLVGSGVSKETYAIRDFMEKNHIWYSFLDIDTSDNAVELLENFNLTLEDLPIL